MTTDIFKPDFDGERGSLRLSGPERQTFLLGKRKLVQRLHNAAMTLNFQKYSGPARVGSGSPAYIVEFSDRVGEELPPPPRALFQPSAAMVSDINDPEGPLSWLNGLRKPFYKVVLMRALHEFAEANGEKSQWDWKAIGQHCGFSERWAENTYQQALIQAARRCGMLPMVTADFGVFVAGVWVNRGWVTHVGTAADPRAAIANLRTKSPVRVETAAVVWVNGAPVAKRIFDELKPELRGLLDHGSWYKANPDSMIERVVSKAQQINAAWQIEDIQQAAALAA